MAYFKNLLLVDDDEVAIFLHQWWAQRFDLAENIVTCSNPKQAISYIDNEGFGTSADLMLVDLNMPVMDGFELLTEILSTPGLLGSQAYIYVLTSTILEMDLAKVAKFPINGCLIKPLDERQIQHVIRHLHPQE